jgi:hypothetical protein
LNEKTESHRSFSFFLHFPAIPESTLFETSLPWHTKCNTTGGFTMRSLSEHYQDNVTLLDGILRVKENFDILKKTLRVGDG